MSRPAIHILEAAARRVGFAEFLIPLIPLFADALIELLAQCANTEAAAVRMSTNPSRLQSRLMYREAMEVLRENARDRSWRARSAAAWQLVDGYVEEASANEAAVVACFEESRDAA